MSVMATAALSGRPAAQGTHWLWVPVLGVGLAALLVGPMPPGGLEAVARPAALRVLHGSLDLGAREAAAILAVALWLVMKPLAVIGALLLLEFRFCPSGCPRNLALAWLAQALAVSAIVLFDIVLSLATSFPDPLIKVEAGDSAAEVVLFVVPAFVLAMLIASFFQYWMHRAVHAVPLLWRFHSLHHSLEVNVLNNITHPLESVLAILLVGLPTALLIGVSTEQLLLILVLTSMQGHFSHSRLPIHLGPLRVVLSDNRYHFIHHSLEPAHIDKNFANVPLWDMLFGTYVQATGELVPTGLADRAPPRTLAQYVTTRLPDRAAGD